MKNIVILNYFCIYRNWLAPLSQYSIIMPNISQYLALGCLCTPIRILMDLLSSLLDIWFYEMLHYTLLKNIHPRITLTHHLNKWGDFRKLLHHA